MNDEDFDDDFDDFEDFDDLEAFEAKKFAHNARSKTSRRRIELLREKRWLQEQLKGDVFEDLQDVPQRRRVRPKTHRPRYG